MIYGCGSVAFVPTTRLSVHATVSANVGWGQEAKRRAAELAQGLGEVANKVGSVTGIPALQEAAPKRDAAPTPRVVAPASYFDDPWNMVDLGNYALFTVSICTEIWSRVLLSQAIGAFALPKPQRLPSLRAGVTWADRRG